MCQEKGGEREGCETGPRARSYRMVKKSLVFMIGAFIRDAL